MVVPGKKMQVTRTVVCFSLAFTKVIEKKKQFLDLKGWPV